MISINNMSGVWMDLTNCLAKNYWLLPNPWRSKFLGRGHQSYIQYFRICCHGHLRGSRPAIGRLEGAACSEKNILLNVVYWLVTLFQHHDFIVPNNLNMICTLFFTRHSAFLKLSIFKLHGAMYSILCNWNKEGDFFKQFNIVVL